MDGLIKEYGKALVDSYIAKAYRYRKTGDQAVLCAAQWLAENAGRGKIKPKAQSSLDLDDYEQRVQGYVPVYRKETT